MADPNPHGANGTTSDPREQVMWDFYVEGLTNGKENAYESAVKAGYEPKYAKTITVIGWFLERKSKLRRKEMLSKAEKKLDKTLDYDVEDSEGNIKVDLLKVQVDVAKHVTNSLGEKEGYNNEKTIIVLPQELISKNTGTPIESAPSTESHSKRYA